ncbi:bifunctional hydroxymethylpyrimidine kinase/phosphomethylpyrimidine kinase [Chryseobacterium carnipullorum]|uniref:hydroxymethylpyrimidine kinase n=1 Tax=Chryseobacterium carnipullorum TaxID=1124835 RepID=A0A376EBZ0_CHRCU|nr:bifunctional hydroxymethylpyrimidine kinase/phosphomethylpyrimidine kinase [Chryseobacterium carnipullorum]AZA46844.1 bifunctional hydroxymethylpyrimidine kinase/phosphomethylpyrimidine kinase [Chryseobacterium carnipullorum]AZA66204.1 bifunctional hydroxymethylpyrimidine kinase/phosphomethylpyrimidine kinase [Chryseobacterium carnipullorum]STD06276.1 Hydroxymethylpyrimidine/phosphomethylpyrimidine kinase [Chryseobacterium carnipullorum]
MKKYTYPSVLTIAGFDGSGGAGIQADIKTASALGCFSTSVLTALPVQNTQGVRTIYPIPVEAVADQIEAILDDIFPDAIKIGMVHTPQLVETIVSTLGKYKKIPLVFDPVMVATSGHRLIEEDTISAITEQLFPIADVVTPNMDEAAILAKMKVETVEDLYAAGKEIKKLGCKSILLKGGHQETSTITSLFYDENEKFHSFETVKFNTNNTHGSGCTLSSAIASYLAQGKTLYDAVSLGQDYVYQAIEHGKDVQTGLGNGPLNHFFNPQKLIKNEMV